MDKNCIEAVLNSWNALQFAVQQQTGGRDTSAIAKWLVDVIYDLFYENDDLEPDEVADYICSVMNKELNVLVEDDSDMEVAQLFCRLHDLQQRGMEEEIKCTLNKLPKSQHLKPNIQSDSDEEIEVDEGEASQVSQQMISMNLSEKEKPKTLSEEEQMEGWTLVSKGKRKVR